MRRLLFLTVAVMVVTLVAVPAVYAQEQQKQFKVGFAQRDVTPQDPTPMWGYGERHALLSEGVRNPLFARTLVIDAGEAKLAIVGMDLGRGPTRWMMPNIRQAVQEASGVDHVLIAGSHTHHGPVIELQDEPGKGQGRFDDAVAYAKELERKLIDVINKAAGAVQDVKIGWGSTEVNMNRNRHTRFEPKPIDNELSVIRFDDLDGNPLVILVDFAAHPTNLDTMDLRFSSEYPGQMVNAVEKAMDTHCIFMQGAAGDLSTRKTEETNTIEAYGKALADKVVQLAQGIETKAPQEPRIQVKEDVFTLTSRVPLDNPLLHTVFQSAFFPELISALDELDGNTIRAAMTTVLLNGDLAMVGVPGEFFCEHSIRLKRRSRAAHTFFFGYCNGHFMYFPTIEAAAEGGYGADAMVSWVELGAGEKMMNQALINIYTMMGKYAPPAVLPTQ